METEHPVDRLLELLDLDRLDRDLFLGSPGPGSGRLFGGMVAAQSVVAACRTVEEGDLHSLHSYFLRPGSHEAPIRFVVYRIRDGRTFTTRDVVAYQSGEAIFNVSCSFTRAEEGLSSQEPAPDVPPPDGLPLWELARPDPHWPMAEVQRWVRESPIEMLACDAGEPGTEVHERRVWTRVKSPLPEDPVLHAAFLTYATDRGLISTARYAHGLTMNGWGASLDHTIWFHRPARFDDWLLFVSRSPVAHAARALIFGQIYRRDGTHVASVAQEGLIRGSKPPAAP
jgi:acyl-CoA thioesterase-2